MASSSTPSEKRTQPENAFEEIAPYFAPIAPTSTEPWDIYIHYHGSDVKQTLATPIYHSLHSIGFRVFLDVEALELGDSIPAKIQHAISSATLNIAIFSPGYVESPWLLAELSLMLKIGAKIIPIFYNVKPTDLRWVSRGEYAVAFSEYEEKGRFTHEKIDEWKRVLQQISNIQGYEVNNQEDEAAVVKDIVDYALQHRKTVPLFVCEHPVGLDELVQDFQSLASEEKVKITGIVGLGGSGKTTLAKALFNRNLSRFKRCSFVSDLRDAACRNALPDMQKKLVKDLGIRHLQFDTVDEGKAVIAKHLRSLRALVVLDDVDDIEQLCALLLDKDLLGSDSMVIVTTRDLGVLKSWGISSIYKITGLKRSDAEQLLCWHAFMKPSPPAGFEALVEKFILKCDGLPLSLKVLGRQLRGTDSRDCWEARLNKISRKLPDDIGKVLRLSFDALDEQEKEMFLDLACCFKEIKRSTAIAVWDGSNWSGLDGFVTLVNKCLVELVDDPEYNGGKIVRMHDHLRVMGKEIASRHKPYRLWCPEEIDKMNEHLTERKLIRGILSADTFVAFKKYMYQQMGESSGRSQHHIFTTGLQILFVQGNEFTEELASFSEDLVWLSWEDFPLKNLPQWLTLRSLRVLELHGANKMEELWKVKEHAPLQLRELIITGTWSASFQRFPNSISYLNHLQKIALLGVVGKEFGIRRLPEEFCDLKSLEHLELRHCTLLSSLPTRFGNLTKLEHLDLFSCKALRMLPNSFQQLALLNYLDLSGCKRLLLQKYILEKVTKLKNLYLSGCLALQEMPCQITDQACLRELQLQNTRLEDLPSNIGELSKLKVLKIGSPLLKWLPESLGNLSNLKSLSITHSFALESLPKTLGHLVRLEYLCLEATGVASLPEGFRQLANLQSLEISDCPLKELDFGSVSFFSMEKLREINLSKIHVTKISISQDCCPRLETLRLSKNGCLMEIETLPTKVKNIELSECEKLKNIKCILALPPLLNLTISDCPKEIEESVVLAGINFSSSTFTIS